MNNYKKEAVSDWADYNFDFLELQLEEHTLYITLDRADKKNALHPQMINEFAFMMHHAHYNNEIWVIVIKAKGNVFCAGMDLKAMAGHVAPHYSTVPAAEGEVLIARLFASVHKPVITAVTGDVYAGGFFFLAGSHIVIAQEGVKLGLPEVRRGIYPFQVMAALMEVMPQRKVIDWCIRGYSLSVDEAVQYGLVSEVVSSDDMQSAVKQVVDELNGNSPSAIRYGLEAFDHITDQGDTQAYLKEMLTKTAKTADGVEGLAAFREKRSPRWTGA